MEQMMDQNRIIFDLSRFGRKFSFKKIKMLKKIARKCDVIVVHHGDPFLKFYFIILKFLTNKKTVTIVHSCYDRTQLKEYGRLKLFLYNFIFQVSLQLSDAIVFVSKAGRESYRKRYRFSEKKASVIYNGISEKKLRNGAEYRHVKNKALHIMYIGRLSSVKGVDTLVKAFSLIRKNWKVKLSIVGDGDERSQLERLVRELKLDCDVFFLGQQLDIEQYLKQADLFVYPSICEEVFGISIVEAMAYGIPCIASAVGGIPEIIKDGTNGFLCPPGNEVALAKIIENVLAKISSNEIEIIVENERKTAANFSINRTVRALETLYLGIG